MSTLAATSLVCMLHVAAQVTANGSIATRAQVTAPSEDALAPTTDLPILESLSELNLKGKANLLDGKLRFGLDASAFVPFGGAYADAKSFRGALIRVDDHDVAALDPFIALSEYFVTAEPIEHIVLTVGKKRTTWGPGLAFSPTDLLNPPRDPTDPSLQRAGFLHARLDVPFEHFTVSALFAPEVIETAQAIPTRVLYDKDDKLHYAAALRAYALIGDADVNAWVLFSNLYGDNFENKPRLALTLSKTLFTIHEFHAEVLLEHGSGREYPNGDCIDGGASSIVLCALSKTAIVDDTRFASDDILPKILVGWRVMPDDGSIVALEYFYQADGYVRTEFGQMERLAAFAETAKRSGQQLPIDITGGAGAASGGEVQNRFAFEPRRRHYLFFSYTRPQVLDDFTLAATAITPLEDLSVLVSGSVTWQAQEWLQLSIFGFAPLPSPARISSDLQADPWQHLYDAIDPDWRGFLPRGGLVQGTPMGEYDGLPFRARVMLEARAFF